MVKQEILEGIKAALEKGETLKQAMMSFYTAGYKKQDIEDAARALILEKRRISQQIIEQQRQTDSAQTAKPMKPQVIQKPMNFQQQKILQEQAELQRLEKLQREKQATLQRPIITQQPTIIQRVSSYGEAEKPGMSRDDKMITILIILLSIVFLFLVGIFVFREKVIELLKNIF